MQSSHIVLPPDAKPIRLAIVDDHPVVRCGLEGLFGAYPDFDVVATASNGREALDMVRSHHPDVLILDIALPGHNGVDVLRRVARSSSLKVVMYSCYNESLYALPMIRMGANAYVDKTSPLLEIIDAVRTVVVGRTYLSPALVSQLARNEAPSPASGAISELTGREFQIFLRLAVGETVNNIAAAMSLSNVTISAHRSRLLKKLNLKTNSHLTRYALENDLLQHAGMHRH